VQEICYGIVVTPKRNGAKRLNAIEADEPDLPEGRVARRRAKARERLLEVAEELMDQRGVDGVTIDDIADGADIARRSFYHHFESKYEILVPISRARTKSLSRRIDRLVATIEDPAEVMATAMRHALREIADDPLCRWFILHSGLPHERLAEGMGESGMRDTQRAIEAGRFQVENAEVVRLLLSGAFIAVASARAEGKMLDRDVDDAVEHLLRMLGLSVGEAHDIAHHRLRRLPRE
jgi:AcrR family transcriptional regulator